MQLKSPYPWLRDLKGMRHVWLFVLENVISLQRLRFPPLRTRHASSVAIRYIAIIGALDHQNLTDYPEKEQES